MKIAYFDCFSGISGDMVIGALLDSGVDFDRLKAELTKLPLTEYEIIKKPVLRGKIGATKISVFAHEKGIIRTWSNIKMMIDDSDLSSFVKEKSKEVFMVLAEAESKVHRTNIDKVHFHEVGAIDSIIDIVGASVGFEILGIDKTIFSPLPTGIGMTRSQHGMIPIPAPATAEILKDIPIYSAGITSELCTPTGAAIARSFADDFGDLPPMRVRAIGYGSGREKLELPNLLRLFIGEGDERVDLEQVTLLETNIDNNDPEIIGYLVEKLLEKGALDVWTTPINMKKNRLATALSVLLPVSDEKEFLSAIFSETDTLGVRVSKKLRHTLRREKISVTTIFGEVTVKVGYFEDRAVSLSPEYDECQKLAEKHGVPLKVVYEAAKTAAGKKQKP